MKEALHFVVGFAKDLEAAGAKELSAAMLVRFYFLYAEELEALAEEQGMEPLNGQRHNEAE